LAVAFFGLVVFFSYTTNHISSIIDDAFISFRYAKNLAEGKGLVFNEGERVEGYTTFLWVLIMAAAHEAGFNLPWISKVFAILCAAALILSVAVFSRFHFKEKSHPYLSYLAPILLTLNPLFLEHIGSGMETLLFGLLLFLAFATRVSAGPNGRLNYLTGILLGLAYLTQSTPRYLR
jgi:hypothetical protein